MLAREFRECGTVQPGEGTGWPSAGDFQLHSSGHAPSKDVHIPGPETPSVTVTV